MDNVQSMFYHNEIPWHKKGVKLDHLANSAEAIKAAGLDWEVEKRGIFYNIPNGNREIKDKFAIVRKDNNVSLGIVGDVYKPLQNKHAFKFFDDVIGEASAFYETAGALGVGEKIWLLAKLPNFIKVKGNDVVEKYLLLANSHNGTSAIQILLTPIRVVCQNTLNLAVNHNENIAYIRHCGQSENRIADVRNTLGIISNKFSEFELLANRLANKMVTTEMLNLLIKKSLFEREIADKKMTTRAKNAMDEISKLFEHGRGNDMPEVKHTAWTAYNAVVEYVDYIRGRKSAKRDESILFGSGAAIKQRALKSAISML